MINANKIHSTKRQNILIALCFIMYTCSYLGKYTFNASINSVISFYKVSEDQAGLIGSMFFFAYGAGQIINGVFCRFYNKKYMLAGALIISAIINGSLFLGLPFEYIKYVWFVNGFVLSCLWSSIVLLLSESLEPKYFSKAIVIFSFSTPLGTILAYAMSALFVHFGSFKDAFLCGSAIMLAIAIVWIVFYNRSALNKEEQMGLRNELATTSDTSETEGQEQKNKGKVSTSLIALICILGVFAVLNSFMRDGLSTWVPKILKEGYELPESISIILTIVVPIFGAVGSYAAVAVNRHIKNPINLSALFFLGEVIMVGLIALCFEVNMWLVLALLGIVNLCSQGICNLLTSVLPLDMHDKINSGLLSGLFNGCGYIGATISTYGLGWLQTLGMDWITIFLILAACALFPVVVSAFMIIFGKIKSKKQSQ